MEAVALAAGVDINHLLGSVMLALQAKAVNTVKIIAIAHPAITQGQSGVRADASWRTRTEPPSIRRWAFGLLPKHRPSSARPSSGRAGTWWKRRGPDARTMTALGGRQRRSRSG